MDRRGLSAGEWLLRQAMAAQTAGRLIGWAAVSAILPRRLGAALSGPNRLRCGLTVVLPGIEGEGFLNHGIAHGLNDAQVPGAIEIFDWTGGRQRMFHNLMDLARNRQQAALLAGRIRDYQRAHPGCPVHLVGHSGGTGIAAMALEQLDPSQAVTAVVMLASALSPGYDLAPALRRTTCGIYSLHSPYDFFYLGWGTRTFGTIDRKKGRAAGQVGFVMPANLSPEDRDIYRAKLRQICWRPEWLRLRHAGGHLGCVDRCFCREWLSRILLNHYASPTADPRGEMLSSVCL